MRVTFKERRRNKSELAYVGDFEVTYMTAKKRFITSVTRIVAKYGIIIVIIMYCVSFECLSQYTML